MKKILPLLMAAALWLGSFTPVAAAVDTTGWTLKVPDSPTAIPVIHVYSTTLTKTELAKAVAAIQIQIDRDFYPKWGYHAVLSVVDVPGAWQVELTDYAAWKSLCMCWGLHDEKDGVPFGRVFLLATKEYPISWSIVLSHEILEMLADPMVDQTVTIGGVIVAIEVADQVRAHGYLINGILVQDFVLPAYYVPGAGGPYDFLNQLSGAYPACEDEDIEGQCNITLDGTTKVRHDFPDF